MHLLAEFLETFTHADSRFWRTMRRLALDPARLTNDYLAGGGPARYRRCGWSS